jgi:hypothetical protein
MLGFDIKHDFMGHKKWAAEINALVPQNAPLSVVRHRHEEYFDVLLYYLRRPVEIQQPDRLLDNVNGYLIARASWYSEHKSKLAGFKALKLFREGLSPSPERQAVLLGSVKLE